MISAAEVLDTLAAKGRTFYSGVPCSLFGPLLSEVAHHTAIDWLDAPNEGDAVAAGVGASLAGRGAVACMQNSGLGNAVNPLTSLVSTFAVPVLLLVSVRGAPGTPDEPQHLLMGRATPAVLDALEIPWAWHPTSPDELPPVLDRACAHLADGRAYALLIRKGTFQAEGAKPFPTPSGVPTGRTLEPAAPPPAAEERPSRAEALAELVSRTPTSTTVVISSTGYPSRELFAIADRPNQLYIVGSMGCASAIALGVSRARPDIRVVVVEGDGSALMRMGNLAMVGAQAGPNLVHVILDNGVHESTGGQPTLSRGLSFASIASACGYEFAGRGADLGLLEAAFARSERGPRLLHLDVRRGALPNLPRPSLTPAEVAARFSGHLAAIGPQRAHAEPARSPEARP